MLEGKLIGQQYRFLKVIGVGTSGRALLVHDLYCCQPVPRLPLQSSSDQFEEEEEEEARRDTLHKVKDCKHLVVLKEIKMTDLVNAREKIQARKEILILSKVGHPNIIKYRSSFEEASFLYIVMEYAQRGDLYSFLRERRRFTVRTQSSNGQAVKAAQPSKPSSSQAEMHETGYLTEDEIVRYFEQICQALSYLHNRKILHRDLKTKNIFICKQERQPHAEKHGGLDQETGSLLMKVGDFGIARFLNGTIELAHTSIGTPYYLSPEICESKAYDYKSDIWALGCVLFELMSLGRHPFEAKNMKGLVVKIISEDLEPLPYKYSAELENLLRKLLAKEPEKRPTIDQILSMDIIKRRTRDDDGIDLGAWTVTNLAEKYNTLMRSFGEEQAFSLMINWLFGPVSMAKIIDRYKWSAQDTFADIIEHIQWAKDRQDNRHNLEIPWEMNGKARTIKRTGAADQQRHTGEPQLLDNIAIDVENKHIRYPVSRFFEIDNEEYFLNDRLRKFNAYSISMDSQTHANLTAALSAHEKLELIKQQMITRLNLASFKTCYKALKAKFEVPKVTEEEMWIFAKQKLSLKKEEILLFLEILINEWYLYPPK